MKYKYNEGKLTVDLDEEIDMHTCKIVRTVIDGYIMKYEPDEFVLNLKDVKFMDSSGVGLLIGRYNLVKLFDSKMVILNAKNNIKKLLQLSNISNQIEVRGEECGK